MRKKTLLRMRKETFLSNIETMQEARKYVEAINQIVELHQPDKTGGLFCNGCADFVEPYPCPTTKIIKKTLDL